MIENPFKILQNVLKIKHILVENDLDLIENVNLKRKIINDLERKLSDTTITKENYDLLITDIISLLEESNMNESYLINEINQRHLLLNLDSDTIDLCTLILNEIGDNLIKTGDYIHPGENGDPENPHHTTKYATFGTDNTLKNNPIQEENLLTPRLFNIPTDKERSPSVFTVDGVIYDVSVPFTQQMLRLEELGRIDIDKAKEKDAFKPDTLQVPQPGDDGYPIQQDLYNFMDNVSSLTGNLGFEPTKQSNTSNPNPWADKIKEEIDPPDFIAGVAEGRSPGLAGEHQKWTDNYVPNVITVTCQTGAVENKGARDSLQMHKYQYGEFGQDGLYHKALNSMDNAGTTANIRPKFHNNLPIQKKESLWTFDGTFPPKLLVARYGDPMIMRHYNFLPIKPDNNRGFGLHTITTHEHNGAHNGVSDGFANSFFFPGEYYDYLYGMTIAGHTHTNVEAVHPKASAPRDWKRDEIGNVLLDEDGKKIVKENKNLKGDWKEIMSTHWFHDHMLDYTAQNVYKGNAAMMNYYSAIDRGNEEIDDGVNLRLPSGTDLAWGNRDYDVNLIMLDKAWDNEGQLWFNPFNTNGFLGDKMLVNWLLEPYFEVRARRYRFRILNAGVSRFMKFALVRKFNDATSGSIQGPVGSNTSYDRVPFWMIANCGNLLMHAIKFDGTNGTTSGVLPVQAIAERFDIIVDFADFEAGDKLYFVNVLEHFNGKRPNKEIPLEQILGGSYNGDPCVMKFMEFRVKEYDGEDLSADPSVYEVGKRTMVPIDPITEDEIRNAKQRNFTFVNKLGSTDLWAIETDGGQDFQADMRRISANPESNRLELWKLTNGSSSWFHNIHIHFTEGRILLRDDQIPPIYESFGRKDVYRIGASTDSSETMIIALRFNDVVGDNYVLHCHNTQHEDHAMLLRFDVSNGSCVKNLPTPYPTWNGVRFLQSKFLPTFRTGMKDNNLFYDNPEKIIHRLKQLDKSVPNVENGLYFIHGVGKGIQIAQDD